ncbi:MAG TPA: hypothetical protein VIS06_04095 [Mycobacteriales bacterium]
MTTDIGVDGWAQRIDAAKAARVAATAVEEQVVRDAREAGLSYSQIARALGTTNRQRAYAILARGTDGGEPVAPALTPVVYLRGAGNKPPVWQRVEGAMWARGWATEHDRTSAWHLARGGVPVVLCDFSTDMDRSRARGRWYGYDLYVVVGRVRAKYADEQDVCTVGELLPTQEVVRLRRAGAAWLDEQVTAGHQELDLPLISGGRSDRPSRRDQGRQVLDEQALARMVAEALA